VRQPTSLLAEDENATVRHYNEKTLIARHPQTDVATANYDGAIGRKKKNNPVSCGEMLNPMHRIWSMAAGNKLTHCPTVLLAKCSFCDVTLDLYRPLTMRSGAVYLVIRRKSDEETDKRLHFCDEAAPPIGLICTARPPIERRRGKSLVVQYSFEKPYDKSAASYCDPRSAAAADLKARPTPMLKRMKKAECRASARVTKAFRMRIFWLHSY